MTQLLKPGDYLERYLILDQFAGAWGVVYVLKDTEYPEEGMARPQVIVAKTLRPEWASQPQRMKQFEHECYTWLSLGSYAHIVRLYTVDRFSDQVYALGEYISQTLLPNTLRGWIDYQLTELEIAFRFGIQIARALTYARQHGVEVHQDLKPENIMVTPDGVIKITDWGISRTARVQTQKLPAVGRIPYMIVTDTAAQGTVYGTPGYAAPELYQAGTLPSPAADIYSLGVILAEMITGERPSSDPGLPTLATHLKPLPANVRSSLLRTITACLSPQPANRPTSLDEIENALCEAFETLASVPVEKRPFKPGESGADLGQRAYALFMLGRIDEAMKLQAQLMGGLKDGPKPEAGTPSSPVIMMDYKEHGFRAIVPQEHISHAVDQLSKSPDSLDDLEYAVSVNVLAGEHETVLHLIEDWMRHSPPTARLLTSAANAAKSLLRFQIALDYIDKALALDNNNTGAWMERVEILRMWGKLPESMASLKELLKRDPKHVMAHITLGHDYAKQGQHKMALSEFQEAVNLDPKNAMAYYNLGTTQLKLEDRLKAVEALEKCIELDKDFEQAYNTLASIYFYFAQIFQTAAGRGLPLGKNRDELLEKALDLWDGAIRVNPKYARPWFNKAQLFEFKGDIASALDALRQAVEIDPHYVLAIDAIKRLSPQKR